ncbi:AraC family transcriptional regulator [Arthrobacter sp. TWP1-1]|uniref:AraC family transcriptional regulator n=1 Tax=Arthrobacter sp. TWP1-1 TaxID=2804568 RepID=UPI003CF2EEBE
MDPLTHLLDGPRARRAFTLRVVMSGSWSIDVQDKAPLTVVAMMTGHAWLTADGDSHRLSPGDVVLVRGPNPYTIGDDPLSATDAIIHPGQICTSASGQDLILEMSHGIRSWGNATQGKNTMLVGTYESDTEVTAAVTQGLPRVAVVPAGHVSVELVKLLEREITTDAPGQGSAADRLLDVLLVHTVRAWVQLHPDAEQGWLAGSTDPVSAGALELFHSRPESGWTLASVAQSLNISRATLASRFRSSVGGPPMSYLTNWRMLLASEMLADAQMTTAKIAKAVGYASPFAFSTAFKRRYGVSPTGYRTHNYRAN